MAEPVMLVKLNGFVKMKIKSIDYYSMLQNLAHVLMCVKNTGDVSAKFKRSCDSECTSV